ncbi:MAG: secretin and TonB N-terminal domain-containing protein [Rhizomicrobium sp.]
MSRLTICWMALLLLASAALGSPAAAEDAPVVKSSERIEFDIPSQPLEMAIVAFGERAGMQVLYDSSLARGLRSSAVKGSFTRDDGLLALLAGTNLTARHVDASSFVLLPATGAGAALDSPVHAIEGGVLSLDTLRVDAPADDFNAYSAVIRSDLLKALQRNAKTRAGNFVVHANIWIGPAGEVRRSELSLSTGSRTRDKAIVEILDGFAVSQPPPAGLPQPIAIRIEVKPL